MSTPTKPERVEVGSRWEVGQRRRGEIRSERSSTEPMPAWSNRNYGSIEYVVTGRDLTGEYDWDVEFAGEQGTHYGVCESWPSTLVAPAPATPGTAIVTPGPLRHCHRCGGIPMEEATLCKPCDDAVEAEFGPKPVYGRLVGELRAPDGTPRTALEAIQAKREPEPWVESCDLLHWLRDA